jgi:hypothetical protein
MKESGFDLERLFIQELFIKLNCAVISQLHILQEQTSNTPIPFKAVVFQWLQQRQCLVTLTLQKMLQPHTCGSYYILGCQLQSPGQETNAFSLLSNSQLAVTSKPKKIPEEQCILSV